MNIDIKKLLKDSNISQSELARRLNITRASVSAWVRGTQNPTLDKYQQILKILNKESDIETNANHELSDKIQKVKYVPILSYVQAGEFTDLTNLNSDDIEYIPLQASEVPNNAFLMRVRGDSMVYDYSANQRLNMSYSKYNINEEELVLVDPSKTNISNLIGKVAVIHNGNGTTVKLVYQQESGICLMPLNSRLQNNEQIKHPDEARIIGKVIDVINKRSFR